MTPPVVAESVAVAEPVMRDEEPPPAAVPAGESSEITTPLRADVSGEIEEVVRAWARAWSAQNVEGYLGFYSASFRVPDGFSRSAWESLRRQRIESPRRIAVTVSDVEATLTGDTSAVARFGQGYRAPGYRDWVLKTLELDREPDGWRIVEERSALIEVGGSPGDEERLRE